MQGRRGQAVVAACLLALAAGCSAGAEPGDGAPAPEITHGAPDEVVAALAARGTECDDVQSATVLAVEEAARCVIDGEPVLIVHFFDEQQGREYEAYQRSQGQHAVFAPSWALETESVELAQRLSRVLPGTSFG